MLGVVNAGKANQRDLIAYMEQGCTVGVLRGSDSTGMFQVNRKGEYDHVKLPYSGEVFVTNKHAQRLFRRSDEPGCSILHHRAATRGVVSQSNAHPFEHYDKNRAVIGVHNGTLTQSWYKHKDREFQVDSDYLMYRIFADGAKATFSEVDGAYACIWYENDGKLRLMSNGERSLFFAFVRGKNQMLIASEHGMLWWLASRNGISVESIIAPKINSIHTFDLSEELRDFEIELVERKPQNFPIPRHGHWSQNRAGDMVSGTTSMNGSTHSEGTGSKSGAVKTDNDRLDAVGVKKRQRLEFYADDKYVSTNPYSLRGMVAISDSEFVDAVMYGVNPYILTALDDADWCEVMALSATVIDNKTFIVVSTPLVTVKGAIKTDIFSTKIDPVIELPEVPNVVETVPGHGGRLMPLDKFKELTQNGCINCGCEVTAAMARAGKLAWVNSGNTDVVCDDCTSIIINA